ncbi:ribosomal protein L29 [Scopulibacillus daqui]|uniref:Ribosomal protein L29 n=1 Tax=Scopulibacillus daqui TaxID=1469162 RepID=A0ABS2Q396_9BACL|nr:hypothetical protein [Scopulibacillus daqui]MBM7646769.1 ribosomal protein L29 [Scopulibacillus daqui]
MNSEELQALFTSLKNEFLANLEHEMEEMKESFKEEIETFLSRKKEEYAKSMSSQQVQGKTQTQSRHIVNGEVVSEEDMIEPVIDGKLLSEQIINSVQSHLDIMKRQMEENENKKG